MNKVKALILAAAMLLLPVAANAQLAYTAGTVALHAGPASDYPVVAVVQGGRAVSVQGCTPDYLWCDVVAGAFRGWLDTRDIDYFYQGARVPLIDYGAAAGIGVVAFVIGNYWQQHYAARPWYRQLPYWSGRPPHANSYPQPEQVAHTAPRPHAAPAFQPSVRPPIADMHPRPHQAGPRPRYEHSAMPTARPQFRGPGTGAPPRPAPSAAHAGNPQRPTMGPARGTHFR